MSLPTSRSVWLSNPKQKYRIIASPDPLYDRNGGRTKVLRDDPQRTFWIDPALKLEQLDQAITVAVASALSERMRPAAGASARNHSPRPN